MESGAMSDAEFDGPEQLDPEDSWRWPTGYDKYYHVLTNKLDSVRKFNMGIPFEQNGDSAIIARLVDTLNDMKHYLAHHNEGSEDGGVITIGVISLGQEHDLLPPSPHAYESPPLMHTVIEHGLEVPEFMYLRLVEYMQFLILES